MKNTSFQKCTPPSDSPVSAETFASRILVIGNARSGTTALFYKIKNSISTQARCLFEPRMCTVRTEEAHELFLVKMILERSDLSCCSSREFSKRILLIRDPRDRLVSLLLYTLYHQHDDNFVQRYLALLWQKETSPLSVSVSELQRMLEKQRTDKTRFSKSPIHSLLEFHDDSPNIFVLRYEDLVDGRLDVLERYLGFRLHGEMVVPEKFRRVERTKTYGNWRHWFTPEDIQIYRPVFAEYLQRYGYGDDWQLSPHPTINPEHASQYTERLLCERKHKEEMKHAAKIVREKHSVFRESAVL